MCVFFVDTLIACLKAFATAWRATCWISSGSLITLVIT